MLNMSCQIKLFIKKKFIHYYLNILCQYGIKTKIIIFNFFWTGLILTCLNWTKS